MKSYKKLSLSKIQVSSFVTSLNSLSSKTLKGGGENDTITIYTGKPTSSVVVIYTITTKLPEPKTDKTGGGDDTETAANDATAGCCAPKKDEICNSAVYCTYNNQGCTF